LKKTATQASQCHSGAVYAALPGGHTFSSVVVSDVVNGKTICINHGAWNGWNKVAALYPYRYWQRRFH
jgi:hypothetical protein